MKTDVITIRFNVIDKNAAEPFWNAVVKDGNITGLHPRALSWGDMFAELRAMESRYEHAKTLLDRAGLWDATEKLERLERMFPMSKIRGTE